jgi:hypothetical protein
VQWRSGRTLDGNPLISSGKLAVDMENPPGLFHRPLACLVTSIFPWIRYNNKIDPTKEYQSSLLIVFSENWIRKKSQ